jgi:carnitine O-acetyltransferase
MMPPDGDTIVQEVDKSRRVLDAQISALSDQEHLPSVSIGGSTPTPSASTPYTENPPSVDSNSSANAPSVKTSITYAAQTELPALPIPGLEETLNKFLGNLEALQSKSEHEASKRVVLDFLQTDGPRLQKLLVEYDQSKRACREIGSYVEEFWNDSYLAPDSSVVLNLNPFFVLEDSPDPKIAKDPIRRASILCFTALKMASQLRFEMLKPDQFRGKALCMDQFKALFATARTPVKDKKDTIQTYPDSGHVAVLFKSQIYIFHALWEDGHVAVDEGDIVDILSAIHSDAKQADPYMVSQSAIGLLTSLGRNEWAEAREEIVNTSKRNRDALKLIDSALFVLVLDDYIPLSKHDAASNMLHGSYNVQQRKKKNDDEDDDQQFQAGSCCNRWYDKLQIIVCGDGTAGINFEHSTVDGHTALRFVSDIYAETVIKFARYVNKKCH